MLNIREYFSALRKFLIVLENEIAITGNKKRIRGVVCQSMKILYQFEILSY